MDFASQATLITGLSVFGVGLLIALLGRLMMNSTELGSDGVIGMFMAVMAGAGARVGGWIAMGIGAVISIVAGVMQLSGS